MDANLSEFIIRMHRNKETAVNAKYDMKTLKLFIGLVRKIKPQLT